MIGYYLRRIGELWRIISNGSVYSVYFFAYSFYRNFRQRCLCSTGTYYLMIKNETYLKLSRSFTHADIIGENGTLKLCWFTDKSSYTSRFYVFSYDDTISILYKTKNPKIFIHCDEKYWRSKMFRRCIVTILLGIVFLPLFIRIFFNHIASDSEFYEETLLKKYSRILLLH